MRMHKFNSKPLIAGIVAVVVIIGIILLPRKQAATTPVTDETSGASSEASNTITVSAKPVASTYKDGTYTATGNYTSPGGPDNVVVTLTLQNGIVTDSTVVSGAQDPTSKRYQAMFIAGYKQYVTGKSIDSLNVGKVSGSSLTAQGFNAAVASIKTEASA